LGVSQSETQGALYRIRLLLGMGGEGSVRPFNAIILVFIKRQIEKFLLKLIAFSGRIDIGVRGHFIHQRLKLIAFSGKMDMNMRVIV
jgi:hypothetical protein